jgi:transposase-like protein
MSEAELHILRARLDGGIRNKAARGELRRGLPVGLVWGEADGEIRRHPDETVTGVIAAIFERFAVCGSVRGVWLWLRDHGLKFPLQPTAYLRGGDITWVEPTYHAVHNVLTHPAYAGAYVFGRTRQRRRIDPDGTVRVSRHKRPQGEWEVLITDHHEGFIDWNTYQDNQSRIGANTRPKAHQPGTGAVREGCALLQGLATCGVCGRKLAVYYDGPAKTTPGYYCTGTGQLVEGRGTRHLRVGGAGIDTAVAAAFLAALQPAALQACLTAAQHLEDGHDAALEQWRRQLEQARYQAGRAEHRYRAVDPDNRLVARGLENEWNTALQALADAETELARREAARPKTLTPQEKSAILALGDDLPGVWTAPSTTDKDRKRLLRSLLDEVNISVHRDQDQGHAELLLRWKGGAITELSVPIKRTPPNRLRTDEDTIDLVRRLAVHYPDATIAHILNRQNRRTGHGLSFTAGRVQSLRHHWKIPCHRPGADPEEGELLTVTEAAAELGLAPSTLHRWLGDGFIAGEQITPGAPWRIRLTDDIRNLFVDDAPDGWLAMLEATLAYGVSRQTIMQRVKRGELQAVHLRTGRRKGLRIQPPTSQEGLFGS